MISLLVPTRARPASVAAMWESALGNADHPEDLELLLYVDDDDPDRVDVAQLPGNAYAVCGPRIVLSECWNECADRAVGEVMWHGADDIRFRTGSWDSMVLEAFEAVPDRIAFVHGRDGVHDAGLGTHGFLHRRWVDQIGWFVPPYFSSDFNDTWLTEVADLLGRRRFLHDVFTEHLHPLVGKGELDVTHTERIARGEADRVADRYAALAGERQQWVDKLRKAMQ